MERKKILLVEDDAVGRQILHARLRALNYDVSMAVDAISALSEAQRNQPDLIILDLGLPAGGGMTVLSRLKRFPRLGVIPVLVLSTSPRESHEKPALEAGAAAYANKGESAEALLAVIRTLLGEAEPSTPPMEPPA